MERCDGPVLSLDGMRRGQETSRRLAPQHIGGGRGDELVGRVRLAAPELADRQRSGEAVDVIGKVGSKRCGIEAVRRANLGGPGKRSLAIDPGSAHARPEKKGMSAAAVSDGFSSARK